MPLTNDIELNGVAFNVVPGAYKKGLRKAQSVARPPARRTGKAIFGPFERGVLQAADEDEERGWRSLTVGPVFDGKGIEPFPNSTTHADAMTNVPSTGQRAYGLIAGSNAYVGIGRRIYKSVLLSNGTWASFTEAADLGAGHTISGLAYYLDDILVLNSSGNDIRKLNTATNVVSIWRAGEKGKFGVAYAGQLIYAPGTANNQELLKLSGTKWNGNAVTHKRWLDAPIINMASFNGQVVIATRKSLYFMGGQPYEGEADDPDVTGDTSKAAEWIGDPEPVMGHGTFAEGDDFTFLESYRGRLYTWLGGRVAEFDTSTDEANWLRIGPEGVRCYGACVAGDWLIVAVESRYGEYEAWGFDGQGWWLLLQRSSAPAVIWPMALAGAGDRDALLFRDGSTTYDLLRLRWRSASLHTYATSGEWVSSLIDGDDPTADKAWRRIGATFAAPDDRGNTGSVDSVSFPLEYSLDGGLSWVTVEDTPAASGATRILTRGADYGAAAPTSRVLQLRQRWSSVSDWAPVLTSLWVEYEDAEEYALGELAQAAYEAGVAAEDLLRRRWEITVDAGDGRVTRAGGKDAKTGRQAIAALWDAWELGTTVTFKDIDHDTDPVTYVVAIVGMEEKAAKPSDSARWGVSAVTVVLEESAPGVASAPPGFALDDLDDVTLGALTDGYVLTYDSGTGQWVAEAPPGGVPYTDEMAQDAVGAMVLDTASVDLAYVDATPSLSATVLPAGVNHNALANLATGDPHTQYLLISAADERAQDAVGAMAVDTATIDVTYTDATPELKWDVKDNSVTYAKMQDVSAASKLIGRGDSGAGDPQEITLGTNLSMSGTTLNATGGGSGVGLKEENVSAGTASTLDFDGSDFNITDQTGGEFLIQLAYGTGAGTPAEGNHTHAYQPLDDQLTDFAGLTQAADTLPYFDSATTMATTGLTAAGRALLDDADAAAQRATLGLVAAGAGDIWVEKAGDTMTGDLIVPDEAYDATGWNGDLSVPTKNAVRDKIESLLLTQSVVIPFGDGVNVLTVGDKRRFSIPVAHTLVRWRILSSVSGSVVFDVWRDSFANYPPTVADTIATSKPTLSAATNAEDATITDWTEAGAAGDVYIVNVDSVTSCVDVVLELWYTRALNA